MNPLASRMRANELLRIASVVRHIYLKDEAALVVLKWPAYRFLSPLRLNQMFRDAYNLACYERRPRESELPPTVYGGIGSKLSFRNSSSQLTQLHLARQHADALGMPYGEYIRFCFDFGDRRERKFSPRPNQRHPSEEAYDVWWLKLRDYWTDERIWALLMSEPKLYGFDIRDGMGLPAQSSFRTQLLRLAQNGVTNPDVFYGRTVLNRYWLHPEDLIGINRDVWNRAKTSAEGDDRAGGYLAVPHVDLGTIDVQQGCHGLPGIDTTVEVTCQACPARHSCDIERSVILSRVRDQFSCNDPTSEAQLSKNRERVRKCRASKRTAITLLPEQDPQPERLS